MALTESQRLDLYRRIKRSSLGADGADLVMNVIPTIDWSDIATHDDIALFRADVRAEMSDLRGELRAEMSDLRGELRAEMSDLRGELRAEMVGLRSDFGVELGALENRLQRSIVTWILAAQGVTLATIGVLVTVLTIALA